MTPEFLQQLKADRGCAFSQTRGAIIGAGSAVLMIVLFVIGTYLILRWRFA